MSAFRDYLIEYSNDVINGDIIACQKHKWACMRFLRDIEREGTEEFPYIFDENKALRFLAWKSTFKHTKGVLQGQRIQPTPLQAFDFGNIYGWVHKDTGLRRFKKAYLQRARKNAKSQDLAAVASYEAMANGVNASEVYIGATKTEQSRIVWNEVKLQLEACPEMKGKYRVAYGKIEHPKTNSFIVALSKEAGKTGDGLNVQCGILDEYHAHSTSEIYDVLVSGMGARPEPLLIVITTAGFDLNAPCYRVEYKYVSQILDPNNPIENDEYYVMINELDKGDDIQDESVWIKANPILATYEEGLNYLRGELRAALDVPEKMRNFLTKNMNIWIDQKEHGYMNMAAWRECGNPNLKLEDFAGQECIVGVDLSSKIDLTSVGIIFKHDGKYYVFSHSFMAEETLAKKTRTDRVDYQLWVKQGWITVTPGAVVDYEFVKQYIKMIGKEFVRDNNGNVLYDDRGEPVIKDVLKIKVKEIVADPWNALQFMQDMEREGYVVIEARQGMRTLAAPTKDFREKVYSKKVVHNNNPVLTWAVGNAVTRQDHNENIMLDKAKSTDRIDPIDAVINAYYRAMNMKVKQSLNDLIKRGEWVL